MNLNIKEIKETDPVSNSVYSILKSNILELYLKPGDRISEQEVSKELKVSRTPVREAFISLSREGLVTVLPQRGTFISRIDLDQVEEGRFVRKCIELVVVEMAVDMITDEYIVKLSENLKSQKNALLSEKYNQMMHLDFSFHSTIFEMCKKRSAWRMIDQVSSHYNMARILSYIGHFSWEKAIDQHARILEALKLKDKQMAVSAMEAHLTNLVLDQAKLKSKYPTYFK